MDFLPCWVWECELDFDPGYAIDPYSKQKGVALVSSELYLSDPDDETENDH